MTNPLPDPDALAIHHDPGRRFWLELDGEVAYVDYRLVDGRAVDYAFT